MHFQVQFQLPISESTTDLKVKIVFNNIFRLAELTLIAKLI